MLQQEKENCPTAPLLLLANQTQTPQMVLTTSSHAYLPTP